MRHIWERWCPRVEDYWPSFSAPYRLLVNDLCDKATPPGGSVMDFGCGVGVQSWLLRQRRPDVQIYAVDCNPQALNLAQVLMGNDDKLVCENTPLKAADVRQVDTIVSIFTFTYIYRAEVEDLLSQFCDKTQTMIFAEPTNPADRVDAYAGMPTMGYLYPIPHWLQQRGWDTEVIAVQGTEAINAITIGRKHGAD